MSSQKKARGLMKEGQLVQMLDRQRVQQAAADEAKKLVDEQLLRLRDWWMLQRKLRKQRRQRRQRRQLHCHRPKKHRSD
jgi:uncharacterized protein YqgQ